MRSTLASAALLISLLFVAACGNGGGAGKTATTEAPTVDPAAAGSTRTITGRLTNTSLPCDVAGANGWRVGDPVVILDGSGKFLAEGEITGKTAGVVDQSTRCDLDWSVPGVPEGASGYQVRAVDEDPVTYDWAQLTAEPQLVKG